MLMVSSSSRNVNQGFWSHLKFSGRNDTIFSRESIQIFYDARKGKLKKCCDFRFKWRMCRWIGSHFHDWIDYHGVAFLKELLEWGPTLSDFLGKRVLHIYG